MKGCEEGVVCDAIGVAKGEVVDVWKDALVCSLLVSNVSEFTRAEA